MITEFQGIVDNMEVVDMELHHIIPKHMGGTDVYKNIIWVNTDVHILIHATTTATIIKYKNRLNLSNNQLSKLNLLRGEAGNFVI
jgi:hypothetical protein